MKHTTIEEFLTEVKTDLRTLKQQWIFKEYNFKGLIFESKRFNNWFQIFRLTNGVNYRLPVESTQKEVLKEIERILNNLQNELKQIEEVKEK